MKKLKYLIIHTTYTPECREVSKKDIEQWHLKENGWKQVGYSDMIHLDGRLENLVPFDQDDEVDKWEITNGAYGVNSVSRHVVYVGGRGKNGKLKDTRTPEQMDSLKIYVKYMVLRHPNIKVIGHNQVSKKSCPCFDVPTWLKTIKVPEKNIGL